MTTESAVIEGPTGERSVMTQPQPAHMPGGDPGTMALALMEDEAFEERLAILKRGRNRIVQIQRELMEEGVDYGTIPNTPKPTLFKPGAEKLAQIYRLAARLDVTFIPGDGEGQPPLRYMAECFLHHGSFDGPVVAVGHGTANSWEKRYRRAEKKACPKCGEQALIVSKFRAGWHCFAKVGGCGTDFAPDHPQIKEQSTSPAGNPVDAHDLDVTLLKMAEKRAFVDAVLRATASSGLFTQDLAEDPATMPPAAEDRASATTTTEGGRQVDSDTGEVVDPEFRDSAVEGVGRGGRTEGISSAQLAQIKAYSKGLKLGPLGLSMAVNDKLGIDAFEGHPELVDDERGAADRLIEVLNQLTSEEAGILIQHLRKLSESE